MRPPGRANNKQCKIFNFLYNITSKISCQSIKCYKFHFLVSIEILSQKIMKKKSKYAFPILHYCWLFLSLLEFNSEISERMEEDHERNKEKLYRYTWLCIKTDKANRIIKYHYVFCNKEFGKIFSLYFSHGIKNFERIII